MFFWQICGRIACVMCMIDVLNKCNLCPKNCNVNRNLGEKGFCKAGSEITIAKYYLHKWEEPCITGKNGSGTIFFSYCNLRCLFCQNYEISEFNKGINITAQRFSEICLELQDRGATNINLVTPTHFVPLIIEGIKKAKDRGLRIPIVYNSSGYESVEQLSKLKDLVDIYLVDFKYFSSDLAHKLSRAKDYPQIAKETIKLMKSYQPNNIYDGDKLIKGVIIRHLILPNHTDDSIAILDWLKDNIDAPCISLMGQYVPMYKAKDYPKINRKIKPLEYKIVEKKLVDLGLTRGYIQDLSSAEEKYTPEFDFSGV